VVEETAENAAEAEEAAIGLLTVLLGVKLARLAVLLQKESHQFFAALREISQLPCMHPQQPARGATAALLHL